MLPALRALSCSQPSLRREQRLLAVIGALCVAIGFFLMASPELAAWKGAAQRLADYGMFAVLILLSVSAQRYSA